MHARYGGSLRLAHDLHYGWLDLWHWLLPGLEKGTAWSYFREYLHGRATDFSQPQDSISDSKSCSTYRRSPDWNGGKQSI